MFPYTRTALTASLLMTLTACATITQSDNDTATYYESSFDDKNRAPASLTPPTPSSDATTTLDPLYMRTQADYNFSMGEAYSLDSNPAKAVEAFKMTLIYDPNSVMVRMRLAAEYLKQGMITESVNYAEDAVKLDSKNIDARLLLGGLYSSLKVYSKALDQYSTVMKLQPLNTEAPLYIGALYSEQKQSEKAVKYFETLAKNPEYNTPYLAYYYIGRVRMEQSEPKYKKMAEEALKKSLSLKPSFSDAVLSLGGMYSKNKQEDRAIELYRQFQKENVPSAKVAEVLAQIYVEKDRYDLALEQLEILEGNSEEPLNIKMKMALILIEQKRFDQAIAKLQDVLREVPDSDKIRFYLAAVYEETKQNDKAIAEFKRVPSASPYFAESVVHAAYLLKGAGKVNEALEFISKGLAERNDQPQIYAMYASLLDEKQDFKGALKILNQGLEKFPENAQLRFYLGTIQDRLGNRAEVVVQMKRVIELDPNHVQGLNYLAFTWADQGLHLADAEQLARRALALEPQDGYVLDTLGWILFKQNKLVESIKVLEAAHKYQSGVSVIAEHLGDAYYKQAMVEKAKKMYKKAVDLETDSKKVEEIRSKITAIEKQELPSNRMPASAEVKVEQER